MVNYVNAYNKLVPMLNKLSQDNFDIWVNAFQYEGYGFKVIFENTWVEVMTSEQDDNIYYVVSQFEKSKKSPYVLDSLTCKTINEVKTTSVEEIENFIRQVAKSEQGE